MKTLAPVLFALSFATGSQAHVLVDLQGGCPDRIERAFVNTDNRADVAFVRRGGTQCTNDDVLGMNCALGNRIGTTTPNSRGFIFARANCDDLSARLVVLNYPSGDFTTEDLANDIYGTDASETVAWDMSSEDDVLLQCVCDKAMQTTTQEESQ